MNRRRVIPPGRNSGMKRFGRHDCSDAVGVAAADTPSTDTPRPARRELVDLRGGRSSLPGDAAPLNDAAGKPASARTAFTANLSSPRCAPRWGSPREREDRRERNRGRQIGGEGTDAPGPLVAMTRYR